MRGIQFTIRTARTGRGIIPAHAGNTDLPHVAGRLQQDHPRACGEYLSKSTERSCRLGSSPRMRGIHLSVCIPEFSDGIIPAHAGNTMLLPQTGSIPRDHPRACGEYNIHKKLTFEDKGSSPRMRGIRRYRSRQRGRSGIIPAHAGNTDFLSLLKTVGQDHPRACGEYSTK